MEENGVYDMEIKLFFVNTEQIEKLKQFMRENDIDFSSSVIEYVPF